MIAEAASVGTCIGVRGSDMAGMEKGERAAGEELLTEVATEVASELSIGCIEGAGSGSSSIYTRYKKLDEAFVCGYFVASDKDGKGDQ